MVPKRKVTFEQAEEIRRLYARTLEVCDLDVKGRILVKPEHRALGAVTQKEIAERYGVSQALVGRIIRGEEYRTEEQKEGGYNAPSRYLSYEATEAIRNLFRRGFTVKQIRKIAPELKPNNLNYFKRQAESGWAPVPVRRSRASKELKRLEDLRARLRDPVGESSPRPVDWRAPLPVFRTHAVVMRSAAVREVIHRGSGNRIRGHAT